MALKGYFQAARGCLAAILLFLALPAPPGFGATFTVNSTADINDLTPGNELCVAYLVVFPPYVFPFCTLRGAIEEANALPGPDRIILPPGEYLLDIPGIHEDRGGSGDLDISDTLVLSGAGADQTFIDAAGIDRVIDLFGPATEVTISGVTIRNGRLPPGLTKDEAGGGGIRNSANLTLQGVRLLANRVNGNSPTDGGGAVLNRATCILAQSTIGDNLAARGGGIVNQDGGSLEIQASTVRRNQGISGAGLLNEGTAVLINSTFSGNQAEGSPQSSGGGILNQGEMDIIQSTVADNQATDGGGLSNEGEVSLVNTLLAANHGGNCHLPRPPVSLGHNLDSDGSCNLAAEGDLSGTDPKIDTLSPHGGPTDTHGLLLGSPAVDGGRDLRGEGVGGDQRGFLRPQGRAFDIGAYETGPRALAPLLAPLLLRRSVQ